MKHISTLLLVGTLLVVFGCAQEKPEAAAQKIFEEQVQVTAHKGLQLDTSGLDYDIVEESDGRALVEVTGLMPVKAMIPLVKQKGKWVLDMADRSAANKAPASR